jgi:hypothetical protein
MKKLNFGWLVLFMFFGYSLFAQSQRLALAEEFTNASCGPCASQNPAFDALLQQNTDKIISIKYHMSWPGTDPMYSQNTVDNNARRSVYGISGVPHVHIDGSWWNGAPSQVNQGRINSAYAVPASFDMDVQYKLTSNDQKIEVTALIKATENINSNNLRLFLVVIEKHIHFNSAPGYNGEKDFYNVMKKILPDKNGYLLKSDITSGEYFIVTSSWDLANVYNNDELSVVAFIQDMNTLEVFQAANGSTDPIVLPFNNDVEITGIKYATNKNCSGTMIPVVSVRNNGINNLTSMTVKYSVNGGDEDTYDWSGMITSLNKEEIVLTDLAFQVQDTNHLVVSVSSVNEGNDEYPDNNSLDYEFYRADVVEGAYLIIYLDNHPEQTTWKLMKSSGTIVQEGGPYTGESGQKIIPLEFSGSDCYKLEMDDAGGDGFTGSGFYIVAFGNNDISFQGKEFTDKEINEISYDIVGMEENISAVSHFDLFPNPAAGEMNISFLLNDRRDVNVVMYDMQGRMVKKVNAGVQPSGKVTIKMNVDDLQTGLYMVKVDAGGDVMVKKVTVK